ncbi:putative transcription factor interactor and regulator CCHC(Zn) family [Helianthus anomalus]
MLRNKKGFSTLTLSKFIEKLEAQEMEQIKIVRMRDFDETTYNAKNSTGSSSKGSSSNTSFSSFPSFDPNISATKNGRKLQCNIVLNLENDQDHIDEVAKNQMSLLGMVLESYSSFVVGRIGNPMLTKEDYDQIDAEEMELMDIKWYLASVLRRAEKFKQITGRDDLREANVSTLGFDKSKVTCFRCREKGHFKMECTNRQASGAQNPFNNNNDYYRKSIYHEDKYISADGKACVIDQNDEKLPEGFSWENFTWDDYIPHNATVHKAFVARIEEESDDDSNEYYAKQMRDHLKMLEESDSEDEKVK